METDLKSCTDPCQWQNVEDLATEFLALKEHVESMPVPKICLMHPETALWLFCRDDRLSKDMTWCGVPVKEDSRVEFGKVLILNEKDYEDWCEENMPTEETDEERFEKKKEEAWRTYPCRICGTRYESKSEAKQCARSHDWQNRRGRR